jgi:hypothetical protein
MEPNKSPSISEQVKTLSEAVKNWTIKDGMRIVPPDILELRKKLCLNCEHWDKDGFMGVGRCKLCGCSAAKLYIPSSSCPIDRWKAVMFQEKSENPIGSTQVLKTNRKLGLKVINRTEPKSNSTTEVTGSAAG